jgi:hypothetical protein
MSEITGTAATREKPDVKCAKCGRFSPGRRNHCVHCGARLYILCRGCGRGNERSAAKCAYCSHPLHHSAWYHLRKRIMGKRPTLRLLKIAMCVVFAAVAYFLIVRISEEHQTPPDDTTQ